MSHEPVSTCPQTAGCNCCVPVICCMPMGVCIPGCCVQIKFVPAACSPMPGCCNAPNSCKC
jgi:hypothetical protein